MKAEIYIHIDKFREGTDRGRAWVQIVINGEEYDNEYFYIYERDDPFEVYKALKDCTPVVTYWEEKG